MPRINRVRIANIHYDKKVIKDLLINCCGGENILLNLANGGGKSVLVQLLQQPLLPESKIQGREIVNYLPSDKTSYILIEWKLDNNSRLQKDYLLTGIVISKLVSNEDMNRTRFFTFMHHYKTGNEFDIKNIPLIRKEHNAVTYKSYEEAMRLLKENRNLPEVIPYTRAEQLAYRNKLAEYGIFTDEWKTLAKINESEGGVDELFKQCKTSNDLIDKWILKSISDSNEKESKELKEMFSKLLEEIIENEDSIKEKEILDEFNEKMNEYKLPVEKLLKSLKAEEEVQSELYNIYVKLKNITSENQEKIEKIETQFTENERELKHIEYEEISEKYYNLKKEQDDMEEQREKKIEEIGAQEKMLNEAKFEYKVQKAAELYQKEKEASAKIKALELSRENLENKNNTNEHILEIEYNLQEKYKQMIEEYTNSLDKIKNSNSEMKKEEEKNKEKIKLNNKEIQKIFGMLGELNAKIRSFEETEKEIFLKLSIELTRNLLGELEEKQIQKIHENFKNEIDRMQEEIKASKEQIEKAKIEINKETEKQEENTKQIEKLMVKQTERKREHQDYIELESKVREVMNFHRIRDISIFKQNDYLKIIDEKRLEYKRKTEEFINKIEKTKEDILELEQGGIHNSREIREMLENADIGYITGEEYLRKQDEKYQKELLEKNPILPYCYLVSEEELEKINTLDIKEEINKLSPIITHSDASKMLKKEKNTVEIEGIHFLSLYHKECFGSHTEEYKDKLEKRLESYKTRKEECEAELKLIEGHIQVISEFKYDEKQVKEMQEELKQLEEEIGNKKEENENSKKNVDNLRNANENNEKKIIEDNKGLEREQENYKEFEKYLEDNIEYLEAKKQIDKKEKESDDLKHENEELEVKNGDIQTQFTKNTTNRIEINNKLKDVKENSSKIPERQEMKLLDDSLEELEAQYEELTKKYEQNKKQIDDGLVLWRKNRDEAEKYLKKYYSDLKKEDYQNVSYSEEIEDLARKRKDELEKVVKEKSEELQNLNIENKGISTNIENVIANLNKLGEKTPIPENEIQRNYDKRKKDIKEQNAKGKEKQKEYININSQNQRQINQIDRIIDTESKNNKAHDVNIEEINLSELINKYQGLLNKSDIEKEEAKRKQTEIITDYKNKHLVIGNILNNIYLQNEKTFDDFYYIYEKLEESLDLLKKYIGGLNATLQNIQNDKNNILYHAVEQGKYLYEELKKISESGKIKRGDRYIQILKIDLPVELEDYLEQRMKSYIDECIQSLREECKQSKNTNEVIEKKVTSYLADRKLLNVTLNVETIKVKLYKFDIENKNSGLRAWEEVIVGNSGGQKFIACFVLISALIEYTRRKELEARGEEEIKETSKVFILDNPFGKTSSKHLLEPMMEISKKFNIQMFCLSDLSQSSITDKFTIIYQLALKNSKYTNNSFLMIEDSRVNEQVQVDTSLEEVLLRSNIEQTSLFNME